MTDKGFVLWFTGLSGSGKSTLAESVGALLARRGHNVETLDGDLVRTNLSKGLGFGREDRDTNVLRMGFVANLLARNGVAVITAAISPYRAIREQTRTLIEGDGSAFVEIHAAATLEQCESRDVKGLYAKARAGELRGFTGIDDPYEPPLAPEVVCLTGTEPLEDSVRRIVGYLESEGLLKAASVAG
jgi:adenylylsulfate kinase